MDHEILVTELRCSTVTKHSLMADWFRPRAKHSTHCISQDTHGCALDWTWSHKLNTHFQYQLYSTYIKPYNYSQCCRCIWRYPNATLSKNNSLFIEDTRSYRTLSYVDMSTVMGEDKGTYDCRCGCSTSLQTGISAIVSQNSHASSETCSSLSWVLNNMYCTRRQHGNHIHQHIHTVAIKHCWDNDVSPATHSVHAVNWTACPKLVINHN